MAGIYSKKKVSFVTFSTTKPKFVLAVMLMNQKLIRITFIATDGSNIKYKGTPFNTAGWTAVEVTGQIMKKLGLFCTKYNEINEIL